MLGSLISGGLSLLGGIMANDSQESQASAQMEFQREMSNTGYQRAVADMKAAGLNPMLAYSQGPASTPGGAMAQIKDAVSPAVQAFQAQQTNSAQVANVNADTRNKEALTANIDADTQLKTVSAGQASATTEQIKANTDNIRETLKNISAERDRIYEVTKLLYQQTLHETDKRNLTQAQTHQSRSQERLNVEQSRVAIQTVENLINQNILTSADIQAIQRIDNLGKTAGAMMPIFELLKLVLTNRK